MPSSASPAPQTRFAPHTHAWWVLLIAALFMRAEKPDLAREQLAACLDSLDAETPRSLSSHAVASLLALSRSLEIPLPKPELAALALERVALQLRSRLPPESR